MPTLQVSLTKLFLVALLTIGGIKLTSLLPQGYYFSFASAFSDELGAFIIPRPVLAARQQCELERAKGVSFRNCAEITEVSQADFERKRQAIVQAVLEAQAPYIRNGKFELALPVEGEKTPESRDLSQIKQYLSSEAGLEGALENYVWSGAISSVLWQIRNDANRRIEPAETTDEREATDADDPATTELATQILRARQSFLYALRSNSPFRVEPITVEEAEAAIADTTDEYQALSNILKKAEDRLNAVVRPVYQRTLSDAGLNPDARIRELDLAAAQQSGQYLLALLIRLFIPFAVVFAWVLLTGDRDRASLAVGAGFAAFILAWPVAMLWSSVVSESYIELRPMFLAFYTAYIISYLTAGFLGASVALALRGVSLHELADGTSLTSAGRFLSNLPGQLAINVTSNAATIAISYAYFGRDVIS